MFLSKYIATSFGKLILRLGCLTLASGCLSPIDAPSDGVGGRLVVTGQISPIADQNIVQLGSTAFISQLPFPVVGAAVTLYDDVGGIYSYVEDPMKEGTYILDNISGVPGRTYYIQIVTPSGRTFESTPEKMPENTGTLKTGYDITDEDYTDAEGIQLRKPFLNVYANSVLPDSESLYLKWTVEEVFLLSPTDFPDPFGQIPPPCFVSQIADPQRITLFNGVDVKTTQIDGHLVASRIIDWTFYERHYFTTVQSSLTREAYEYWRKVDILANQVGSIFDTPPAEIKGNVFNVANREDTALGYFQATNQVLDRFYLVPYDLPFTLTMPSCTYYDNRYEYPQRCLDCLSVRNSSYNRPPWF